MKIHSTILALLAVAGAAYAITTPAAPASPAGSQIEHTHQLTTDGSSEETDFHAFDQFDPANGTLDAIQFGVKIDAAGSFTLTDTDGQRDGYLVSCDSCTEATMDLDDLGVDGVSYHQLTARVGSAPAGNKITRKNYLPVQLIVETGEGSTELVIDNPDDWQWSGDYTDATLLSQFTGTSTKRVYGDFDYENINSVSFDSVSIDLSDYEGWLGVRYIYH